MAKELSEEVKSLTHKQQAFIEAWKQIPFRTQDECARLVGLRPETPTHWKTNRPDVWIACEAARAEAVRAIAPNLNEQIALLANEALEKKAELLRAKGVSAYVRDQVATYILDRVLGKTADRIEHTGKDGDKIEIDMVSRLETLLDKPITLDGGDNPS